MPVYSIASGLDYHGVGPVHFYLKDEGRVIYKTQGDEDALKAFQILSEVEGIIPALESSHALVQAIKMAPDLSLDKIIIVNLFGGGDKDVNYVIEKLKL